MSEPDHALLLVALNMALTRSRDSHSALCEGIGDYGTCRKIERAAWAEVWTALTDTALSTDQFQYLVGYPIPKHPGACECTG